MSGIAGVYKRAASASAIVVDEQLRNLLLKLDNRGQNGFGIVTVAPNHDFISHKALRPLMPSDLEVQVDSGVVQPVAGIANTRYPTSDNVEVHAIQPVTSHAHDGEHYLALSFDGALVNGNELQQELPANEAFSKESSDADILLNLIVSICQRDYWGQSLPVDYEKLFREIDRRVDGAVSALVMDNQGNMAAFRNKNGLRPLHVMQSDDGFHLFASETCAFAGLHGKTTELPPSHIKIIDGVTGDCTEHFVGDARHAAKLCAYETLYIGNPSSLIHGESILTIRHNLGAALGRMIAPKLRGREESIVIASMPRTGIPYADGLYAAASKELGDRVERLEVVNTQSRRRTLIGNTSQRKSLIKQKYRVMEERVAGRTIVIADEALIRGDTSENVTRQLLEAGAKEVHWAIGSPPIIAPNYYGMGIQTLDELVFWRIWKDLPSSLVTQGALIDLTTPDALASVESRIAATIEATSVTYVPLPTLRALLPSEAEHDLSPFTFRLPTPAGQQRADDNLKRLMLG